jgi:hypothetical protein
MATSSILPPSQRSKEIPSEEALENVQATSELDVSEDLIKVTLPESDVSENSVQVIPSELKSAKEWTDSTMLDDSTSPILQQKIAPPADPNTPVVDVDLDNISEPKIADYSHLVPAKTPEQSQKEQGQVVNYFKEILYSGDSPIAASEIIDDMITQRGEFARGATFENIKNISTTGLLDMLLIEFPDLHPFAQEVQAVTPDPRYSKTIADLKDADISPGQSQAQYGQPVRNYDIGIEQIKQYLRAKKFSEDFPIANTAQNIYTAIYDGFSEIVPAINRNAWKTVNLVGQSLKTWLTGDLPFQNTKSPVTQQYIDDIFDINGIKPPRPKTFTGMLTEAGVEGYVAYATGRPVFNLISPILTKWMPQLSNFMATKAVSVAASESIGGGLITTGEERWSTMFHDLGMNNDMITQLAKTEDEGIFEERFYSWVDATYAGMAFASINPVVKALGKSVFFIQQGARKGYSKWNQPQYEELLNATSGYMTRIRQAYPKKQADRVPIGDITGISTLAQLQEIVDLTGDVVKKFDGGGDPETVAKMEAILKQDNLLAESILVPKVNTSPFLRDVKSLTTEEVGEMVRNIDNAVAYNAGPKKKKGSQAWKKNQTQPIFNLDFLGGASDEDIGKAITAVADQIKKTGAFKNVKQTHLMTTFQGEEIIGLMKSTYETALGPDIVDHVFSTWAKGMEKAPAMIYALNHYIKESVSEVYKLSEEAVKFIDEGGTLSREQTQKFASEYLRSASRLHMKGNIGRSMGRASDANKINPLDDLAENWTKAFDSKEGRLDIEAIARNLVAADGDTGTLANIIRRNRMGVGFDIVKNVFVNGLLSGPKTLTAIPVGIFSFSSVKHLEGWSSVGMGWLTRRLYQKNFSEGVSVGEMSAEAFGFQQAAIEVLSGRGYIKRSPFGRGKDAFRSLDSGAEGGTLMDVDILKGSSTGKVFPLPGEYKLQNGLNEQALYDLFPDVPQEQVPELIKELFNTAGFWTGLGGRGIVAEDAIFRTFLERMAVHRESYALGQRNVQLNLEKTKFKKKKDDKYNFIKGEWKSQEGIRKEFKEKAVDDTLKEYYKIIQNPTNNILKKTKDYGREGLMQNEPGDVVKFTQKLTNTLNSTPNGNLLDDLSDAAKNTARLYATTKVTFAPTMTNILKQSMTERGFLKLLRTATSPNEWKTIKGNERYAQETLSKIMVGGSLQVAGVGMAHGLSVMGYELVMEGIDANTQDKRYIRNVQGRFGSEIILLNHNNGEKTIINIDRLDVIKQPLVLGAIFGSYLQQYNEAMQDHKNSGLEGSRTMRLENQEEIEEIQTKAYIALGKLLTDHPITQGATETLGAIPGFGSRDWDITKELGNFFGEVFPLNSVMKSARSGLRKYTNPYKTQKPSDQKGEFIPIEDGVNVTQTYTFDGQEQKVDWEHKVEPENLSFLRNLINRMKDMSQKVGFLDNSDPLNPKLGPNIYQMVDPAGYLVRHMPNSQESELKQVLDAMVLPVNIRTLQDHPVTQLIDALDVPYNAPKYWKTGNEGEKFMTFAQKYEWAVLAGQENERVIDQPFWKNTILQLKGMKKFKYKQGSNEEEEIDLRSNDIKAKNHRAFLKEELEMMFRTNKEMALLEVLAKKSTNESRALEQKILMGNGN